jgi:2-polyprenyl-3-methyl-5-hydroxy-6-metoxy-1,4-benzoquinol methylase
MNKEVTGDPFGEAVHNYFHTKMKWGKKITIYSSVSGVEKIKVPYLFRSVQKMPLLERLALKKCIGKTFDVGACAGSHALELQKEGIDVTALEISKLCCDIMEKRGVKKVNCSDIYNYEGEEYDTILLLMNGIGLAGTIDGLSTH